MREQEMRMRVFRFLRVRMRNMIVPATIGIGIAAGACGSNEPVSKYMGPIPSDAAQRDVAQDVAKDEGPMPSPDGPMAPPEVLYGAAWPVEAGTLDLGGVDVAAVDLAGHVDFGPATDSGLDSGSIIAKYIAPMLDAASDGMPVVRYGTPSFDAGGAQPLYMAPTQS
jgi:hypothetical protein